MSGSKSRFGASAEFVFAVGSPVGARSIPWRVRVKRTTRPSPLLPVEIYIDALRPGQDFHASLHASGEWHVAFDRSYVGRVDSVLPRDGERIPVRWEPTIRPDGLIRAFSIIVPATDVQMPSYEGDEKGTGIYWAPKPGFGMVTHWNVLLVPAAVRTSGWPGSRGMKSRPIGSMDMAGWGRLWIVVNDEPEAPQMRQQWNDFKRRLRVSTTDRSAFDIRAIYVGDLDDGTMCFTDLLIPFHREERD